MSIKAISLLFAVIFLAGCQGNVKKSAASKQQEDASSVVAGASASEPINSEAPAAKKALRVTNENAISPYRALTEQLIKQGQQALAEQRLLTPEEDNANLYFQAVLGRDPGNYQATLGIASIVDRYNEWAWRAAQQGNYSMAERYLDSARLANPEDATISQMSARVERLKKQRLDAAKQRRTAPAKSAASSSVEPSVKPEQQRQPEAKEGQFFLPKTLFSLSDDEIIEKMQPIIDQVAKDKSDVAIYWPNDKEARLLYQIINSRVLDYRVRAMIYHRAKYMVELQQN
ncbi:hypothetical protein [Marinomonas pollencensis]|uniref:Tetratricopeptide repeat protein n=1 Tax=Marinomonas pollencensis TaxID=491954 RepID=A0A3E0DNA9_9GAMM|nr:hypothetical protein [Marinomonas pollencensis]REG84310.1 hypothetical protein DFP81_104189 [Marinomonas pollencensis]